ncbi:hypothetical protein JZ751_020361 [Albula glossodonta]|uniref:Uncharacterized protein n=1 Tax=Albula glossodonta TaxID=121402 RepID=A0A8T2NKK2_9TELE|nr:hypothetical protein JZ751_020361 [Albula glossodonta]
MSTVNGDCRLKVSHSFTENYTCAVSQQTMQISFRCSRESGWRRCQRVVLSCAPRILLASTRLGVCVCIHVGVKDEPGQLDDSGSAPSQKCGPKVKRIFDQKVAGLNLPCGSAAASVYRAWCGVSAAHPCCFEDDEPECVEEIEYLNDSCPEHGGEELDADVNGNTSDSEEEEEEEEQQEGEEEQQPRNGLCHTGRNSHFIPHHIREDSLKTFSMQRTRGVVDITNGQYLG